MYPASMPSRPFNSCALTQNLGIIRIKNEQRWDLCLLVLSKKQKNTKKNGRKKSTVWRETGDSIVRVHNKYYSVWRAVVNYTHNSGIYSVVCAWCRQNQFP